MNLREKIARLLSPLLDVALRSRTMVKFFLTLGIFISANLLAYLFRFDFNSWYCRSPISSWIRRSRSSGG